MWQIAAPIGVWSENDRGYVLARCYEQRAMSRMGSVSGQQYQALFSRARQKRRGFAVYPTGMTAAVVG